ncbi:MAG: hypothetical protein EU530_10275 [Promethearchaeota archaeon]|nr:MAG: hypothetical protein EU530_10275 [Candidatus Lokiarchaeota archaeon]
MVFNSYILFLPICDFMKTCPSEQRFMSALRLGTPDKVTNFVQSIMGGLQSEWRKKYGAIPKEKQIKTPIGDFSLYKAFGYDTHWHSAPRAWFIPDGKLRRHILKRTFEINKDKHPLYVMTSTGAIYTYNKTSKITFFVRPGIETVEELRFFIDHLRIRTPTTHQINRYLKAREICMQKDFLPVMLGHIVVEPGNQSLSFSLTARLMRKNPELLHEFYDLLSRQTELSFKAAIKAGWKCFATADDCAFKTGPMFSPKQYREFVIPYAKRICDIVRDAEGVIFMHTGMTIERVKKKWGDKLAVIGNVDTTDTLSFQTPQDARDYVHRCFREAKGDSDSISGYIFAASGSLHDKVKLENAQAMLDEYRKIRDGIIPI